MKVGIIGFRGVGKTTVFSALTGLQPAPESGGKVTAHLGQTAVADSRVDRLSEHFRPRKTTHATIDFVDIAGMGAEPGKELDGAALNHLRATDALVHVVQAFENPASPFRAGAPTPARDLLALEAELLLTDLVIVEKRVARLEKEQNTAGLEYRTLAECQETLEADKPLRVLELSAEQDKIVSGFGLLTRKPMLVLVNMPEDAASAPVPDELADALAGTGAGAVPLAATLEAEIAQLSSDEQKAFLQDLQIEAPAKDRFVRAAYELLDLITFLTVGEDEVRAWSIRRGATALEAAGAIHSDLARGFIRAEVISFSDFMEVKSMAAARSKGLLRLEGKEYLVRDGDIVHVRFNV